MIRANFERKVPHGDNMFKSVHGQVELKSLFARVKGEYRLLVQKKAKENLLSQSVAAMKYGPIGQ